MIISNQHRFIFIAVGKTGTSSIEKALEHLNEVEIPKHTKLSEINRYSDFDTQEYFKFCFTRNPWDRVASLHAQWKKPFGLDDEERFYLHKLSTKYELNDFVKIVSKTRPEIWSRRTTKSFISSRDGDIDIDFVGFFENLQKDFDKACDKIGLERQRLPRKNMTLKDMIKKKLPWTIDHCSRPYDDEARNIIAAAFKCDIDLFHFEY